MNAKTFLIDAIDEYSAKPSDGKLNRLRSVLERFDHEQIGQIFEQILNHCKVFPKVSHVMEQARELGFMSTPPKVTQRFVWSKTDCSLCGGEGRLTVYYERYGQDEAGERISWKRRFVSLTPLRMQMSDSLLAEHRKRTIYPYYYRCSCPVGRDIKPRQVPRWGGTAGGPESEKESELPF